MNKKYRQNLAFSLVISAISLLFALATQPSPRKKTTPWLSFLAVVAAIFGLFVIKNPDFTEKKLCRCAGEDEEELFDEEELASVGAAVNAELSNSGDADDLGVTRIHIEIPRDEEASEADFS